MDLSPREAVPTAVGTRRKRPWLAIGVLAVVVIGGGVLVFQFLTNAIDYYCNVDEVGEKDGCDVGRTIRIQGVVEPSSVDASTERTEFVISFNGVSMPVIVGSEPTGLFTECVPVVVAGKAIDAPEGRIFEGTEVIVKHDNQYDAENPERIAESEDQCSRKG